MQLPISPSLLTFGSRAAASHPEEAPPRRGCSKRLRARALVVVQVVSWLAGPVVLAATLL